MEMAAPTDTSDFIQKVIVEEVLLYQYQNAMNMKYPLSFYVHISLIQKLEKRLNERFPRDDWDVYEKTLQFGDKRFDMYQIIIARGAIEHLEFICNIITSSQWSFPLEDNPTIFIENDLRSVNIMKEFITKHKLERFIIKTKKEIGISTEHVTIKVVTFDRKANYKLNIIKEFRRMYSYIFKYYFYITNCFPWECTSIKRCIPDNIFIVLPIIVQHLETIHYKNELNTMDLISLWLALNDVHDPLQLICIKSEIYFLIKRQLAKYITNNIFNLHQYLIDTNSKDDLLLSSFLIYEFQENFKAINYNYEYSSKISKTIVKDCIKLKCQGDVLKMVKDRFNVHYDIDGDGFDQMSSSLFFGLLECANVLTIDLDTNHQWAKDVPILDTIVAVDAEKEIIVNLRGGNTLHFADDCLAELKRLEFHKINLTLSCSLDDYRVLDNLSVKQITFNKTAFDNNMLEQLHQSNIKSQLKMISCTIANGWQTWELINNLTALVWTEITEDEGTWESIFEFVENELRRTKSEEFRFAKDICVNLKDSRGKYIDLKLLKFTFDEQMSKLEIRNAKSDELVDLFYQNSYIEPDENFDFEFYQ